MNDIRWLDGKDAVGQYILEISYFDGSKGYLKNTNHETICWYYGLASGCPDFLHASLYDAEGKLIAAKSKMACAA